MSPIPAPVLKGAGVVIVTYSVIKLLRSIWRYYKYFKFFNSIPGETDFHWLLGNTHKASTMYIRIHPITDLNLSVFAPHIYIYH